MELLDPVDECKLDEIQSNKGGSVGDCCDDMLRLWLQKQPYATWNQLIEALKSPGVELFDVAAKIEGMLNGKRVITQLHVQLNDTISVHGTVLLLDRVLFNTHYTDIL